MVTIQEAKTEFDKNIAAHNIETAMSLSAFKKVINKEKKYKKTNNVSII
jgi:hypothetical protein